MPNITGTTIARDQNGSRPVQATTANAMNAARMMKSPWARLTTRMMPNTSDSPVAKSAYRPPSSTPCTTAFTQSMAGRGSDAEVRGLDLLAAEVARPALEGDPALAQAVQPVARRERAADVLLDEQGGGALAGDGGQRAVDLVDHRRGQAERELV